MYQFEYRLGPQQWAEFSSLARDRAWRADRNRRVLSRTADAALVGMVAGLGLFGLQRAFKLEDTFMHAALVGFVVFFGLGVLVALRHARTLTVAQPKRDGIVLGKRLTVVDDAGVDVVGETVTTHYDWRAIERVDRSGRMVIFWMEPTAGIVVPRSAFASEGEMTGLVDYANDCVAKAFATKSETKERSGGDNPALAGHARAVVAAAE